ncbi:hypothetical protein [Nostoc sp.]|uniref:hypothetical protein n=1 Tax=Nostoc sp. TaxID=1180 RepID=UPI002FF8ACC8
MLPEPVTTELAKAENKKSMSPLPVKDCKNWLTGTQKLGYCHQSQAKRASEIANYVTKLLAKIGLCLKSLLQLQHAPPSSS